MALVDIFGGTPHSVLITGGAGYLGSVMVPLLSERGHSIGIFDRFYYGPNSSDLPSISPDITIIDDDILNHDNNPDLLKQYGTVIHLAGLSNDPSCDLDPNLTIMTNFLATVSLARRAKTEGVSHFIFASSCSVYGASEGIATETSTTTPITLYALSKLECERELLKLADSDFRVTILRMATLFGYSPRMRFDLAVNAMTKRALQSQPIIVTGDGQQYRAFLHVKDAALGFLSVVESDETSYSGEIFNMGGDEQNYSILNLATEIQSEFPNSSVDLVSVEDLDTRSYQVTSAKIRDVLGITSDRSILDGAKEIKAAYKRGEFGDMDRDGYYNLLVMGAIAGSPAIVRSPAADPRWSGVAQ